ncbi:hypothetical protein [Antarctobacter jejuensis]|uniref:hypothetical protein n=1 Tax=Antarctobacter jejuensis TaxID=1439938 RepID=UPI003FD5D674
MNTLTADTLEVVPIGSVYLIRSRASGAVIVLGQAHQGLARAVAAGSSQDELCEVVARDLSVAEADAPAVLDEILRIWREAGLFGEAPKRDGIAAQPEGAPLHFQGSGGALTVFCANALIAAQLSRLLQRFRVEQPPDGAGTTQFIGIDGDGYRVWRDGVPLWDRCGRDAARYFTLRTAAEVLCGGDSTGAVLHAGAVQGPNGALVLTGTSGSGKSTSIGNLVAGGSGYLADDVLPIDANGTHLFSFPVPLGLKEGGGKVPTLQALYEQAKAQPSPREHVSYVDLAAEEVPPRVPMRALILPRYDAAAPECFVPVPPEEALRDVLLAGAHFPNGSVAALARMLSAVPIYRLHFQSTEYALARCREVM